MTSDNLKALTTFTLASLPNLDVVTLGALELFAQNTIKMPRITFKRPLVVGSVNAAITGQILFEGKRAVFADENDYQAQLSSNSDIDGAVLISASGGKHSVEIARFLKEKSIDTFLLTHNESAPAREYISAKRLVVFPKNREPYSYNTSTYLGPIIATTSESPEKIHAHISTVVAPLIPSDLAHYRAFCLIVPKQYVLATHMMRTKFDELFGPEVCGRAFTTEGFKHAKTIVNSPTECFITFGEDVDVSALTGTRSAHIHLPLPSDASHAAVIATTYFTIGRIQAAFPPYFKRSIEGYADRISRLFGQALRPIVE